jgi:uncharacterized SAM-binding protein YcdF (DUF218 family)
VRMNCCQRNRAFLWTEAVLLALSAFFAFALIGYRTLALVLLFTALVVAAFRLLKALGAERPAVARTLERLLVILLSVGVGFFIVAEAHVVHSARSDDDPDAPYLLVLGAGVNGTVPSLSMLNRLEAAKAYLEEYRDATVIVSGGQGAGEDITEAECMRLWLEESGIEPDRIIKEEKSSSTQENIRFALDIIAGRGGDPRGRLAIVSSEYHLYRAKLIAEKLGAEPYGVAARTTYVVLRMNYFIREAFAVAFIWTFG